MKAWKLYFLFCLMTPVYLITSDRRAVLHHRYAETNDMICDESNHAKSSADNQLQCMQIVDETRLQVLDDTIFVVTSLADFTQYKEIWKRDMQQALEKHERNGVHIYSEGTRYRLEVNNYDSSLQQAHCSFKGHYYHDDEWQDITSVRETLQYKLQISRCLLYLIQAGMCCGCL